MGWIKDAFIKNELNITDNRNCPFCNPERRSDVATEINACEAHKWVSREWFESIKDRILEEY